MDAPIEHGSRRRRRIGMVLYAVIVGAFTGILLARTIDPEVTHTGTALYMGMVVAVVTIAVDTILRALLDRWPIAAAGIPFAASAAGVLAGWWALNNTMGGPT